MDVTVALTTFNRADLLTRTLDNMRALRTDRAWELLVIDNASTDNTQDVLAHADGLPLRVLREERAGKAHAANLAAREARGQLILWTDDDVRPAPDWIDAHADAAERHPEDSFFGGPVRPWFESPPPRWLETGLDEVALAYALLDLGPQPRVLRDFERFNGPNWSARTEVARRHAWDPAFGPMPAKTRAGGESEVQGEMMRDGHVGRWVPGASVEHFVPASAMTLAFIRYRYRMHGRTLMAGRGGLSAAVRSLLTGCLEAYPRYLLARGLGRSPGRWLRPFRRAHTHFGKLSGHRWAWYLPPPPA